MVSAQVKGAYRVYIVAPDGTSKLVSSGSNYFFAPGGSSEGVIANTPEKWNFLPLSPIIGGAGYQLLVTLEAGAAATVDASDGAINLPIIVNGQSLIIGNSAHASGMMDKHFTVTQAAADIAYVASNETPYLIYTANPGVSFQVGNGRVFLSIEDNS